MESSSVYKDIAARTGGDIYIGVVGPVRTGKSTFVKKFMEELILPRLTAPAVKTRARDELPQSAAGRTIMTTEPKFIPETAVRVDLEGGGSFNARLIDCVGYMVDGAMGHEENEKPRMVKSPWFEEEVPFDVAAETGTRKVIRDHSTIGLVITTDGSISDIPREKYRDAEARVIAELTQIHKPFVILLNCLDPNGAPARELAQQMEEEYGHTVLPVNCVDLGGAAIDRILQSVLYEFDVKEIAFAMPRWITMLEPDHWLQQQVYAAAREYADSVAQMKDVACREDPMQCEALKASRIR